MVALYSRETYDGHAAECVQGADEKERNIRDVDDGVGRRIVLRKLCERAVVGLRARTTKIPARGPGYRNSMMKESSLIRSIAVKPGATRTRSSSHMGDTSLVARLAAQLRAFAGIERHSPCGSWISRGS